MLGSTRRRVDLLVEVVWLKERRVLVAGFEKFVALAVNSAVQIEGEIMCVDAHRTLRDDCHDGVSSSANEEEQELRWAN